MQTLQWTEAISVGIRQFDEQHRQLLDLLGMLNDAIERNDTNDSIELILQGFIDYAVRHCTNEEQLMREHGYPELDNHRMEHSHLLHILAEFREDMRDGRTDMRERLRSFIVQWLNTHVCHTDKRYTEFFHARGVF